MTHHESTGRIEHPNQMELPLIGGAIHRYDPPEYPTHLYTPPKPIPDVVLQPTVIMKRGPFPPHQKFCLIYCGPQRCDCQRS